MSVNAPNDILGSKASNFFLKNVDTEFYSLNSLKGKNGTVISFICNHCPYVISIIQRLNFESKELKKIGINTIAIMSNDSAQYPEDSFDNMVKFAKKYNFEFPYLHDEKQEIAYKYGAVCTPDIFGFNNSNLLQYRGRIDSGVMGLKNDIINRELYQAMKKIKSTGVGPNEQFNSFGCSIKWKKSE